MEKVKQMGIWMDHSNAYVMELNNGLVATNRVVSEFTHQEKEEGLSKNEKIMHNKEQHQKASYYKKLGETIRNYQEVVLFGPTDAKNELFNQLKTDHLFENIKIEVKNADKMQADKMHEFVKEYFK